MDKKYAQYLLKKTIEDYNLIAPEFSSKRAEPWPELKSLFDNYLEPGDRVLDLGCGNGRFFKFCRDKDADYYGVDSSEKLIQIARARYPQAKFQTADALNLPFPDNYFNKIYSVAVFHHIPSRELRLRFLGEAKRALKPGGTLILTVWNFRKAKEILLIFKFSLLKIFGFSKMDFRDFLEPWGKKIKRYYHYFSKNELAALAKKAGFKVTETGLLHNQQGTRRHIYLVAEK